MRWYPGQYPFKFLYHRAKLGHARQYRGHIQGPYIDAWVSNWGTSKQYIPLEVGDGDLKFNPTANYVDYYGMKSGLPIKDITQSDAESGYNAEYPWKDRDPRFYKDIIFDGTKVVQGNMSASEEKTATLIYSRAEAIGIPAPAARRATSCANLSL
ncbi:RagB/SusD family nutrient uptake outer membrane protein [Sphingobacterium sp. E70]|uniref:RagB/SusD family nutrient uptake outer membrane protein n=1 Tax=Sphingobacterium sp. E70 TaxID=2853439 RepID=UPI00211C015B|nr:RagB/SusD family nutrient uptake outer membrane protein [Sphingobacterium sp. E70]